MKVTFLLLFMAIASHAQTITGKWKTVDDATGEVKSIVEIFERDGKYHGRVIKIFHEADPDPICEKCPADDERYRKKVIGMEIIKDMEHDGDEYTDGEVLDPEAGKIYRCKLWLEGNDLKVRGYWGFLYRTQTWKRA